MPALAEWSKNSVATVPQACLTKANDFSRFKQSSLHCSDRVCYDIALAFLNSNQLTPLAGPPQPFQRKAAPDPMYDSIYADVQVRKGVRLGADSVRL